MCDKRNSIWFDVIVDERLCECKAFRIPIYKSVRIDKCLKPILTFLREHQIITYASCCGHNKYPRTIVYRAKDGHIRELFTGEFLGEKKRFYRKDENGYYYIPELCTKTEKIGVKF